MTDNYRYDDYWYSSLQEARHWARKLYRENQALLAQVQQLQRALFEMHKREQQHGWRQYNCTPVSQSADFRDLKCSTKEMDPNDSYHDDMCECDFCAPRCPTCGFMMQAVRPGKWQCPECE